MYALYRREVDFRSKRSERVEEVERRPLLEMPIEVQRRAHHYLAQLVAAAGGEWQLLRGMMLMKHRRVASTLEGSPAARNAERLPRQLDDSASNRNHSDAYR